MSLSDVTTVRGACRSVTSARVSLSDVTTVRGACRSVTSARGARRGPPASRSSSTCCATRTAAVRSGSTASARRAARTAAPSGRAAPASPSTAAAGAAPPTTPPSASACTETSPVRESRGGVFTAPSRRRRRDLECKRRTCSWLQRRFATFHVHFLMVFYFFSGRHFL